MAITVKQLVNYSWMSQASYLDFVGLVKNDPVLLIQKLESSPINSDKEFAVEQANTFTTATVGFGFHNHMPNDNVGFSATAFKSNENGHYIFSVRGTEASFLNPTDLIEDFLGVVLAGKAADQVISGYRYYKQLITPIGVQVTYSNAEIEALSGLWFRSVAYGLLLKPAFIYLLQSDVADNKGLGIVPAGSVVDFTGHSLGGHVAALVANIAAQNNAGIVGEIVTYNAPGLNAIPSEFSNWLGIDTGQRALVPTLNIVGEGGLNVTAGLGAVYGPKQNVFIEVSGINPLDSHSIVKLSDSLALYDIFAKLVPALSEAQLTVHNTKITNILKAISNQADMSLETSLDSLRNLFKGTNTSKLDTTTNENRDQYYANLLSLQGLISAYQGTLTIDSLVGTAASQIANLAQGAEALAYRYALKELNPFAIVGNNGLYAAHNTNGELDLYVAAQKKGGLTEAWLADRAAFLAWKIIANTADVTEILRPEFGVGNRSQFKDMASEYAITLSEVALPANSVSARQFVFGTERSDFLQGGSKTDRLYGEGGADYLRGRLDNDYLEGGTGIDVYEYNGYSNGTNDGEDVILDTDGKGILRYVYNETGILGLRGKSTSTIIRDASIRTSGTNWQSTDGKFTYQRSQNDLIVTINGDAGGQITLRNFKNGDFGIQLFDEIREVPQTVLEIFGDREPVNPNSPTKDSLGNLVVTATVVPDQNNTLYGSRPAASAAPTEPGDKIDAGGGNDRIFSDRPNGIADNGIGNADWIIAGAGRDFIEAGAGNDLIEAGADGVYLGNEGGDIVDAGAGDDEVYGDTRVTLGAAIQAGNIDTPLNVRGDWLIGGAGDDWLVGGRANDLILGGAGKDVIIGGAGNDDIYGDHNAVPQAYDWGVIREVISGPGVDVYQRTIAGAGSADSGLGAADVIYAGAGNDWSDGGAGDDFIDAGPGDDVSFGGAGADILIGGAGNDVLIGDGTDVPLNEQGGDYLDGGAGNDYLDGGGGDDVLIGDIGNDILRGGDGNDILIGGPGFDQLEGGTGKDTYVFNRGDGIDVIIDPDTQANNLNASVLVFGDGIKASDITFRTGSLLVDLGPVDPSDPNSSRDMIHFEGFDQYDPRATPLLSEIRFADGTSMSYEDILAQGFDIDGTEGDDDGHDADHPMLSGTGVTDRIRGFGGNDVLLGADGDDVLDGGSGNDHLQGGAGNDILLGGVGNDVLLGEGGDDVLDGGAGADTMAGGPGNDTYIADFSDTIIDTEGSNAIQFSTSVALDSLLAQNLAINGENYLLLYQAGAPQTIPGIPDGLKIKGDLDQINFSYALAGGEVLSQQQLLSAAFIQDRNISGTNGDDTLMGYAGNDTLSGYSGNDTLIGGKGDDSLIGYDGSDTYLFKRGDGQDTIQENGLLAIGVPDTQGIDAIRFGAGITPSEVTLTRRADGDLEIAYGSADRITVKSQYLNIINAIERIEFADGTVIDAIALAALPIAPITGSDGDDVLSGTNADDTVLGLAGNDALDGGPADRVLGLPTGNDRLEGGAGADRYAIYVGMGQDTLVDASGSPDEASTLALEAGLAFDNLKASREGNDLIVGLRGTPDSARIAGYYDTASPQHWQIGLADGTTIPIDELINRVDPYADSIALQAREDYRQGVLANWNALSRPVTLPSHAYVFSSWSQTTTTQYFHPAFPPIVEILPPVENREIYGYGVRQGSGYAPVYPLQYQVTPVTANQISDDAVIHASSVPQATSYSTRYGVSIFGGEFGGGSSVANTYATGPNYVNSTVSYSSTGWRSIALTPSPGSNFSAYFILTVLNEQRVVEAINAGDGNNTIIAGAGADHVALVDAGGGDDVVYLDANDFVYGNDGDDTVYGGYLVYGGDGNDSLFHGANLYGGAGNDWLVGGSIMSGGEGDDFMAGYSGQTQYLINPAEAGEDYIEDSGGIDRSEFEYRYFQSRGIPNLDESWQFGGRYGVIGTTGVRLLQFNAQGGEPNPYYNDSIFSGYEWPSPVYESLEALQADLALYGLPYRGQDIRYIQPLPPAPWVAANDYAALEPFYASGLIDRDIVAFGNGVNPEDITVTRNVEAITLSWGQGRLLHASLAQPWDLIGTGIEQFSFANGQTWSIREALNRNLIFAATHGDDDIYYTENDDHAFGLDGNDALYGFGGNDILDGGAGDDYLAGGLGSDTYVFGRGSGHDVIAEIDSRPDDQDTIAFGPGITPDDISVVREGNDLVVQIDGTQDQLTIRQWFTGSGYQIERVLFENGTQWDAASLEARLPANLITGSADADYLEGAPGNDAIRGFDGNDSLFGYEGNDTLDGGAGDDYLDGGPGDDTYLFRLGYGIDTIFDESGNDTILFGEGITPDMLTLGLGSLLISVGSGGDAIHIEGFDPNDVYGSRAIENFVFAGGETLTYEELIARGIHIYGSDDDDYYLYGTNGPDIIYGYAGDDHLSGADGHDILIGGPGNDYLQGGTGNDIYVFERGDGYDIVYDWDETPGNFDTLRFGAGIAPDDVTFSNDYGNLVLGISGTDDQVVLQDWYWEDDLKVEQITFADGTVWDVAALEAMVPMTEATGDDDLIFGTSGDDVIDGLDGNDQIIGGSGDDLLVGSAGDDYLSGGRGTDILLGGEGADGLEDWSGHNYFDAGSGDDAVYSDIGASFIIGGSGDDWIYSSASGNVIAHNAGDGRDTIYAAAPLTLSLGGGIHAADLSLSRDGADLVLGIGATDSIRLTRLWESEPDAWPQITLQLIDGVISTFSMNTIINIFKDLQLSYPALSDWPIGDALALSYLGSSSGLALGGKLAWHYASTGSNDGLAPGFIRDILSDPAFGATPQPFEAATETNHAPIIGTPLTAVAAAQGSPFVFTLPANAFFDPDLNDLLTLSAALANGDPLPDWLNFDGANFYGTPGNADVGSIGVAVTATDSRGLSVTNAFVLNVENVNDAPTLAAAIAGQTAIEDTGFSFTVPEETFADIDAGDVLSYAATLADGAALPAWLAFDAASRTFSGTPLNDNVGALQVRVFATDQSGAYVSNDFTLTVTNTNDAPQVASAIADQSTLEDALFTFTVPAGTFADVDIGDTLTFSATLADGATLPAWLAFDAATRTFSGTPGNSEVGTLGVTVTATDVTRASVSDTFELAIANVNDAPHLLNNINNLILEYGNPFVFQLPSNTFADIDAGDVLTYGATLASGAPLPEWLEFDAATRTFSGTPDEADLGTLRLDVTATDTSGASASGGFDLTVSVAPDMVLAGDSDNNRLEGRSGNDTLHGLAGDDMLIGNSGNDRLNGGPGDDLLVGGRGDDVLSGGTGNDLLAGGPGNDVYLYQAGDGLDTIADESGSDTVAFGAGLTRSNVVARMSGDAVRIRMLDANGSEQADQGLDILTGPSGITPIEWFTFATGAPATLDDLLIREETHFGTRRNDVIRTGRNDDTIYADRGNDTVYGGSGNDVIYGDRGRDILYGEAGNDVLIGGRGKDQLYGGHGDDVLEGGRGSDILDGGAGFNTYVFERNFGDDRIVRGTGSGALSFGAGIAARDLSFKRRNNDLVVKVKGEGRIRIEGWFDANAAHQVARAEFADGTILTADRFVANGLDHERERDEDDDDDDIAHGNDDSVPRPHRDDHDGVRFAKLASAKHKTGDLPDSAWFEKVVGKWEARYARAAQAGDGKDESRSGASSGAQTVNRWQRMHDRLSAHLADGHGDDDNGGADLAALRQATSHSASFAQFGAIGYGGIGLKDRGAGDLKSFSGLKEGLARIV